MSEIALIKDGIVRNIIVVDDHSFLNVIADQWDQWVDLTDVPLNVDVDWQYDGTQFIDTTPVIEPVP